MAKKENKKKIGKDKKDKKNVFRYTTSSKELQKKLTSI